MYYKIVAVKEDSPESPIIHFGEITVKPGQQPVITALEAEYGPNLDEWSGGYVEEWKKDLDEQPGEPCHEYIAYGVGEYNHHVYLSEQPFDVFVSHMSHKSNEKLYAFNILDEYEDKATIVGTYLLRLTDEKKDALTTKTIGYLAGQSTRYRLVLTECNDSDTERDFNLFVKDLISDEHASASSD